MSSTAAMYSAGVFTFSCPLIFIAPSETLRHQTGSGPGGPSIDELSHDGGTFHERAGHARYPRAWNRVSVMSQDQRRSTAIAHRHRRALRPSLTPPTAAAFHDAGRAAHTAPPAAALLALGERARSDGSVLWTATAPATERGGIGSTTVMLVALTAASCSGCAAETTPTGATTRR